MDDLFENIGGKLKGLARFTCVMEALAAIITGICIMVEEAFLAGLCVIVFGPIVAWVSTWLLYAFGELVEKTVNNERNSSQIL